MANQTIADTECGVKICPVCGEFNAISRADCCLCLTAFDFNDDAHWAASTRNEIDRKINEMQWFDAPAVGPAKHSMPRTIHEIAYADVWLLTRSLVDGCIRKLHAH